MRTAVVVLTTYVSLMCHASKIVLTNDDGWAVAQIRAQYAALKSSGFDVSILIPDACFEVIVVNPNRSFYLPLLKTRRARAL